MKQARDFYDQFDVCREHDIPFCAEACPFGLDIIDICQRIDKKRFNAAYKTLRDAVVFPGIVAELCPAYCQNACIRKVVDDPVQIRELERAIIAQASRKEPNAYNLPKRPARVAVIGAGVSGMAFALKMATRKYDVTVFERESQVGGSLAGLMAEETYISEFELQFKSEKYNLILDTEITSPEDLIKSGRTAAGVSTLNSTISVGAEPGAEIGAGVGAEIGAEAEAEIGATISAEIGAEAGAEMWTASGFDVIYIATGDDGNDFGIAERCHEIRIDRGSNEHTIRTASDSNSASGKDGNNASDKNAISKVAIFKGGSLCGFDLMHAIADGVAMANVADNYIKTGSMEMPEEEPKSKCVANEDLLIPIPAVRPGTSENATNYMANKPCANPTYTENEAIAEASRCIKCKCDGCFAYCDLVRFYEKSPVKMRDEIFLSVKPAGSLVHKSPARKYIAACTECRVIADEACPEHIELCGMIKAARHQMHAADKMPAAYKQYFVRDAKFANGVKAAIVKPTPNKLQHSTAIPANSILGADAGTEIASIAVASAEHPTAYAFFPGCSLGALNPDYVIKPYKWLLSKYPDTALILKCCNVPLDWAGNTESHEEAMAELKTDWETLGKPTLVTACLSCDKHLHEYLPEIETITLYELMAGHCLSDELMNNGQGYPENILNASTVPQDLSTGNTNSTNTLTYSVFDPCSARGNTAVQGAVRALAKSRGTLTADLPKGDLHGCCGFGGQGAVAQPDFIKYVTETRAGMSANPYLVYCANCYDVFVGQGKPAKHILDILFDIRPWNDSNQQLPNVTQRRVNRVVLKQRLLTEIWAENNSETETANAKTKDEQGCKASSEKLNASESNNTFGNINMLGRNIMNYKYELVMSDEIAAKVESQRILADDICNVIERAEDTGRRTRNPENGH